MQCAAQNVAALADVSGMAGLGREEASRSLSRQRRRVFFA